MEKHNFWDAVDWNDPYEPIAESTLAEAEARIGVSFPVDLRALILAKSPCYPVPNSVFVRPLGYHLAVRFLSVADMVDAAWVLSQRIDGVWIPFADDEMGDYYLLNPAGDVYLWLHEREFEDPEGMAVALIDLQTSLRSLVAKELVDPDAPVSE